MQKQVFDGLKAGAQTLKEIQSEMSIEEIENIMADTAEAIEYQKVPVLTDLRSKSMSCWLEN